MYVGMTEQDIKEFSDLWRQILSTIKEKFTFKTIITFGSIWNLSIHHPIYIHETIQGVGLVGVDFIGGQPSTVVAENVLTSTRPDV